MVNRIEENIHSSCDTSSCNIAFKSVMEDNSATDMKWKDDGHTIKTAQERKESVINLVLGLGLQFHQIEEKYLF